MSGPDRDSISPQSVRAHPYVRPAPSQAEAPSTLVSSLLRRGLGWLVGGSAKPGGGAIERLEAGKDEEGVPLSSQPALARSRTTGSLADRAERPWHAPASVSASLSARSGSPRLDGKRRTAHSRLELSASKGSTASGASMQEFGALPHVNGADVFRAPDAGDRYHPSSNNTLSRSPFAPPLGDLRLRSPSPNSLARVSQPAFPFTSERKRGLSPLNPHAVPRSPTRSVTGGASHSRIAWSPNRGYGEGTMGSQAGSSVLGGSRPEAVFGGPEPKHDLAKNEAERILDVLESLRPSHGDSARRSHSTRQISVPAASPPIDYGDLGHGPTNRSVFISPYARRQHQEQIERQEARRRTLSAALRQRDREAEEARRRKTRPAAQAELSPPPESRRKRLGMEPERGDAPTPERRRRARARGRGQDISAELVNEDAMEEDAPARTTAPPRATGARESTPRLQLTRAGSADMRSPSPPRPLPKIASPPPASSQRGSRASSAAVTRPGRTHSSRLHQKASSTFTPDDEDEDPPTDENALRQAKLPKFSFPANFSFNVMPSPSVTPSLSPSPGPSNAIEKSATDVAGPSSLPALPPIAEGAELKEKEPAPIKQTFLPFASKEESLSAPKAPPFSFAAPSASLQSAAAPSESSIAIPANPFAAFQGKSANSAKSQESMEELKAPSANPFAAFQGFGAAATKKADSPQTAMLGVPASEQLRPSPSQSAPHSTAKPAEPEAEKAAEADTSMMAEEENPAQSSSLFAAASKNEAEPPAVASAPASKPSPFAFSAPSPQPFSFGESAAATTRPPASTSAGAPAAFSFGHPKMDAAPITTSAPAFGFSAPAAPTNGFSFGAPKPAEPPSSTAAPFSLFKPAESTVPFGSVSKEAPKPPQTDGIDGVTTTPAFSFSKPAESAAPAFQFTKPAESASVSMQPSVSAESGTGTPFTFANAGAAPVSTAKSPSPFAAASTPASAANPFAAFQGASATPSVGAFGSQSTAQPAFTSFGAATQQQQQQAAPAFSFGSQINGTGSSAPAFGTQAAAPLGFGSASAQPAFGGFHSAPSTAAGTSFAFGQAPAAAAAAASPFGATQPAFGAQSAVDPSQGMGASGFTFGAAPAGGNDASSLFNVGSGGNEAANGSTSPRKIRPLPQGRRGSRR